MKSGIVLLFIVFASISVSRACNADGDDLIQAATALVDETARQAYANAQTGEKKISYASVIPSPNEKNVVITFTINEDNIIHVVTVQGGYAFLNHYIKSSLEGKAIKTESAIPGINYVMAVKLPTSV